MKPQLLRVAAYALVHASGRILLCRLSSEIPRWKGHWTLPGGGLNFGESPEDAMVREVAEETGLVVEARSLARVDSIFDTSGDTDFHGIRIIYRADVVGGTAEVGIRIAQETWPAELHDSASLRGTG